MSITKLAQEIEALEQQLANKRGELLAALGGAITLSKPTRIAKPKPVKASKVVQGPTISERVRSELSKRPGGISFANLRQLPSLADENPASIKSVLKHDRAAKAVWFDGDLYGAGDRKPAQKKTPRPVKARGAGSAGESANAAPMA